MHLAKLDSGKALEKSAACQTLAFPLNERNIIDVGNLHSTKWTRRFAAKVLGSMALLILFSILDVGNLHLSE